MKICYLVNQYPKVSHTFIRREILALEKLGVEILRISARRVKEDIVDPVDLEELSKTHFLISGNKKQLLFDALLECIDNPVNFFKALKSAVKIGFDTATIFKSIIYLIEACSVKRKCAAENVDHLHAHFGTNPATVALFSKLLGGPSYSFTVHGPDEFDNPLGYSLPTKIEHAKFVVAITSFCKSQLFRWSKYENWKKIKEVHCAVDETLFEIKSSPISRSNHFINIGRLSEQKGQMLLLESIVQLRDQGTDIQLDLVGDGELRGTMESYVREHQIENQVNFLGWQSTAQIIKHLDNASALLLPSFAEGLPVVIMEAFARSRPVITTRINGIPELVDENCGFLVYAGDVESLTSTLKTVTETSTDTLDQLGREGCKRVTQRHDSITEAQKLLRYCSESP